MHIFIDHKEAVLKKGASFDYISENRFFTGADSYTLSITFPLKGCHQNLDIFGHINRKDSNLDKLLLDCEIHDRQFRAHGAVNIVEISESEVKTQFLMGKSVRNYVSDLDDIYINHVRIGSPYDEGHFEAHFYWKVPGQDGYDGFVCLPWVNNTSGNMQNELWYTAGGLWYFKGGEDPPISRQYYLVYVLEKILEEVKQECGYTYDISKLKYSFYRYLIIFNTFPWAWRMNEWGEALPHWTVTEFLEQIELFTNGEFIIDSNSRNISFRFNAEVLDNQEIVEITSIIDEHQVEFSEKEDTKSTYMEQTALKYAECDHQVQKYYSCPWAINTLGRSYFSTISALRSSVSSYLTRVGAYGNHSYYNRLLYARDIDTYFVLRCYRTLLDQNTQQYTHYLRLWPVNVFGPRVEGSGENARFTELSIVPVCIDHCSHTIGDCVFLECGSYGDVEDGDENQTRAVNVLNDGEPEKKEEYFDKLYVGFWNGIEDVQGSADSAKPFYPIPWIDNYWISQDNRLSLLHHDEQEDASMRLKGPEVNHLAFTKHKVDQSKKFTFKFLVADGNLPDIQSIFLIHGKKYLAEKMTATFTEDGMSQLVKMVAYRLIT